MKTRLTCGMFLLGASVFAGAVAAQTTDAEPSHPAAVITSPFTNAIPRSVFRDTEVRDPFCPVGYKKPVPLQPGDEPPKPTVNFKLEVTGISEMGNQSVATLQTGEIIEPGETYPFKDGEGRVVAEYKILRITGDKVVALFDGKEYEFKVRGPSLQDFIEKEETHEDKKP